MTTMPTRAEHIADAKRRLVGDWLRHNPYLPKENDEIRQSLTAYIEKGIEDDLCRDFFRVLARRVNELAYPCTPRTAREWVTFRSQVRNMPERIREYVLAGGEFVGLDHSDKRVGEILASEMAHDHNDR